MRYQPEADYGHAANAPDALVCCLSRLRTGALLGLGLGDRFEAVRGSQGSSRKGGSAGETSRIAGKALY